MKDKPLPQQRPHKHWPTPTTDKPSMDDMRDWDMAGGCETTDGCWVEPDGECQHGHPSWLIYLGWI